MDRARFSQALTEAIANHPLITLRREEVTEIPEGIAVLCTGPLTSEPLAKALQAFTGLEYLSFLTLPAPLLLGIPLTGQWCFRPPATTKGKRPTSTAP